MGIFVDLGMTGAPHVDLGEFLDREVYPRLFDRMDAAFPEFGFKKKGRAWVATTWPAGFPYAVQHENPDRLSVYPDRPYWVMVHGHSGVRWLDYVNGGRKPSGPEFVEAVRRLAEKAGVTMPERLVSTEEAEKTRKREGRRGALATVTTFAQEVLRSDRGKVAREYLSRERGLSDADIETLGLGLYPTVAEVAKVLKEAGVDKEGADDSAVLWNKLEGYILFPWSDANGQPLTIYGRWPGKPPEGKPKTIALPGEGTKASPLYFDLARRAGHKDVVLVEGVLDAALLQAKGDTRVIACVGAQLSGAQVETLVRYRVRSVTICLDPDGGGDKGTLACVESLEKAGIASYVAPRLPDGLDPDEFLLREGVDGWRAHIDRADHAFRFKARTLIASHRPEGGDWTDKALVAALDAAIAFDASVTDPDRLPDLAQFFWPEVLTETGADWDAINARLVAAREKAEAEKERLAYEALVQGAHERLKAGDVAGVKETLREEIDRLRVAERHWKAEPVFNVADEMDAHEERLGQYRGREFIGIPQRTIPKLDEMTLGLRGLMLLAAAPNVGKTTLAIQFGLDTVIHNEDAAFLFLSLEMSRWEMLSRLKSRLAEMDFRTLVFGSQGAHPMLGQDRRAYFTHDEMERLNYADETLRKIGHRIRILDDKNFPAPTLEKVLDQVETLKASSGASRVFVLVDYLQVWPVPDSMAKHIRTDLDADKWRIGQMKELRDGIGGDPVMVISEARKPSDKDDAWGGDMSDVMGSARGTYTPDMVLLLRPWSDMELGLKWHPDEKDDKKLKTYGAECRDENARDGYADQKIHIAKGRDGVQRGRLDLRFHFRRSTFEEL